jgi:hypothetical protein
MVLVRSDVASERLSEATSTLASMTFVKASVSSARVPDENAALEAVARWYNLNLYRLHHM